ncbi:hypothetical protein N7G274_003735 [Stereocaulon virgatum]|uniref:Peroxin 20 n=1 Tax=Stereocaulon virgatum TaxID=373712 RepID=A0ABR4AFF2_9LECA
MADSLCGPSNPLQTFQKQTAVDRSLQQDRLALHPAQAESFRSAPGPEFVTLDADFEAFQASHGLEAGYPDPQYLSDGPQAHAFAQAQAFRLDSSPPQVPNWASDFQDLHPKEAQGLPIPQSQFNQYAPLQRTAPGGWQHDFMHQQAQSSPYQPQQQQKPASGWAYDYTGGLLPQYNTRLSALAQQKQPGRNVEGDLDEAAFERAFEDATSELKLSDNQVFQQNTMLSQDLYGGLSPETERWLDHNRIGADRILDNAQDKEKDLNEHDEADELARTAGQLLENVSGDQSQKFQESNFLSLMRQLRDKEVRIEGDKLVDTSQPLHPGGQNYPNEGSRGANDSELERNDGVEARMSGRMTGEPDAASNTHDLLMENGIDPRNLSPSHFQSFQRQTLKVQQKSIQIYAANVANAQTKQADHSKLLKEAWEQGIELRRSPWWPKPSKSQRTHRHAQHSQTYPIPDDEKRISADAMLEDPITDPVAPSDAHSEASYSRYG